MGPLQLGSYTLRQSKQTKFKFDWMKSFGLHVQIICAAQLTLQPVGFCTMDRQLQRAH